eukprot:scaffold1340_cov380-Prasinococcus_capsulatus_cf.AAC.2
MAFALLPSRFVTKPAWPCSSKAATAKPLLSARGRPPHRHVVTASHSQSNTHEHTLSSIYHVTDFPVSKTDNITTCSSLACNEVASVGVVTASAQFNQFCLTVDAAGVAVDEGVLAMPAGMDDEQAPLRGGGSGGPGGRGVHGLSGPQAQGGAGGLSDTPEHLSTRTQPPDSRSSELDGRRSIHGKSGCLTVSDVRTVCHRK